MVKLMILLVVCAANCAHAAEELKLGSSDGSTGFVVRDQGSAAVFSVNSAGGAVIAGTAAVAGAAFTVGGSTLVVTGGRVGIGTAAPSAALDVNGGLRVGNYAVGSLPSAAGIAGAVVFNTTAGKLYVSDGADWKGLETDFDGDGITSGLDTDDNNAADANAAAGDVLTGKTFYAGGAARTGAMPSPALDPGSEIVSAGYYNTTLSAVDADLAAANIVSGVTIFGVAGTALTAPPTPTVGGTWLLVPGDPALGTRDFWVQKYEAKNVGSVAVSTPNGTPWASITQTAAKTACEALGAGYHLLTMPEALTISRNIENIGSNWTGGSVGSGGLWRGHSDNVPANSLAADVDSSSYTGTGNTWPSIEKRTHQLSSGDIWDWSGNVWEWVDMTCTAGAGVGNWYDLAGYIEWSDANLSDYEKVRAGPAGAYTSTQNAGKYYGCTVTGNAVLRGGYWNAAADAGVFVFYAPNGPSLTNSSAGFRCGR